MSNKSLAKFNTCSCYCIVLSPVDWFFYFVTMAFPRWLCFLKRSVQKQKYTWGLKKARMSNSLLLSGKVIRFLLPLEIFLPNKQISSVPPQALESTFLMPINSRTKLEPRGNSEKRFNWMIYSSSSSFSLF